MRSTLCARVRTSPTNKRPQAVACKAEQPNATKRCKQKEGKPEEASIDAVMVYQAHQELIGRIQIPREQVRVPGQQIALDSGEAGLEPEPH